MDTVLPAINNKCPAVPCNALSATMEGPKRAGEIVLFLTYLLKTLITKKKTSQTWCKIHWRIKAIKLLYNKNPAYGRHQLSRPVQIVGPIQFWRGCMIYRSAPKSGLGPRKNADSVQAKVGTRSRVWQIPFFDRIRIPNIIRFSEITEYRISNTIRYWEKPNTEYRILFGIKKIRIPNTNSTIRSNYSNTEY